MNMAVCHMRLAEAWRAKEAAGEEVPSEWTTGGSRNAGEEQGVTHASALQHISAALKQCTKAIGTRHVARLEPTTHSIPAAARSSHACALRWAGVDKSSMKAHYRRGQAFRMMGDLVKAKDDLTSAARRAPESREIRMELEEVRREEEEEAAKAKELWKGARACVKDPTSSYTHPH